MSIADIFPTPIYVDNYKEQNTVKNLVSKQIKKLKPEPHLCSPELVHYGNTTETSIFKNKEFRNFKQWCEKSCEKFITETLGYELEDGVFVTDSWINVCNTGGFQQPHFHTNSFISGTYYVNYDKDLGHSPLVFQSPSNCTYIGKQAISLAKVKETPYNSDTVCFPQNGDLILWQSHILHGHFDNNADDRISISMNFMPKVLSTGQYGFRVSPY